MVRTSVVLSDETAARLRHESRSRGVSVAHVVREAVEHHLAAGDTQGSEPRRLSFFAAATGRPDDSELVEERAGEAIRRRSE